MVQIIKVNKRKIAVICSAAVLMLIGSTMAYFSSTDATTNRLTAWWKFDIVLTEEHWNPENGIYALPGDILPKDPRIINQGVSAYVFLRVTVPSGTPAVEYETGTDQGSTEQAAGSPIPLYKFVTGETYDATYSTTQYVYTDCWTLLADCPAEKDGNYIYIYAYTDTAGNLLALNKNETTGHPLFDAVRICNFNETYDGMETQKPILVEAFGIQSDHLEIDELTPETVWSLLGNRG